MFGVTPVRTMTVRRPLAVYIVNVVVCPWDAGSAGITSRNSATQAAAVVGRGSRESVVFGSAKKAIIIDG